MACPTIQRRVATIPPLPEPPTIGTSDFKKTISTRINAEKILHYKDFMLQATTDARTMTAYEASYFSSLGHGIFWSYLCRKQACQFFGPNNAATWIQSKGHYWFRCPLCGYQHMPWAFMRRPHQSSACQKSSQNCTNRARGDGSEYIRADYIKLIIT